MTATTTSSTRSTGSYLASGRRPAQHRRRVAILDQFDLSLPARSRRATPARAATWPPAGMAASSAAWASLAPGADSSGPLRMHTSTSSVNLTALPSEVMGVKLRRGHASNDAGADEGRHGRPAGVGLPQVSLGQVVPAICRTYSTVRPRGEVEIMARIAEESDGGPAAGFVGEGGAPFGTWRRDGRRAGAGSFQRHAGGQGGRGNAEGMVPPTPDGCLSPATT